MDYVVYGRCAGVVVSAAGLRGCDAVTDPSPT